MSLFEIRPKLLAQGKHKRMRNRNSKKLYTYWNNLRGERPAPDRREIEPSDIREILGDTFILEFDCKYGNISFRLAGTRLCNLYGKELKGEGFLSLWREEDNMGIYDMVNSVFETSSPCLISYVGVTESNKTFECEMLLFPLFNGSNSAFRILGASFQLNTDRRGLSEPIVINHLKESRVLDIQELDKTPPLTPAILAPTGNSNVNLKQVHHLTVIEGGIKS